MFLTNACYQGMVNHVQTSAMVKDDYLRIVFIPMLGIVIPIVAGALTYKNYSIEQSHETFTVKLPFIT